MSHWLTLTLALLVAWGLGWLGLSRGKRRMRPILERLAEETGGEVVSPGFIYLPKLLFNYGAVSVELTSAFASDSSEGGSSTPYTSVLFREVALGAFRFRILPHPLNKRSLRGSGMRRLTTEESIYDDLFIYTNDEAIMQAVLDAYVEVATRVKLSDKAYHHIFDIRNDDGKLIYAVETMLTSYEAYRTLLASATQFLDSVQRTRPSA